MKCFTKISLVLLSCFSFTKGAAIPNDSRNVDLSSFFANLLEQQQTPAATPVVSKEVTQIAGVNANQKEVDDEYTQDDIRKYTKFLLDFVNGKNIVVQEPITTTTTTTTTTTAVAPTTSASNLLGEIKDISSELDQIKERRVDEIDELINIIKNVSQRLETLEDTVEQKLAKQEAVPDTVDDTKEVDLKNAEVDTQISPINENDLKYAAIFNAFNKKNEEKIAEMQENEIKLLQEIKDLLSNNANVSLGNGKAIVAAEETNDKEVQQKSENVNASPAPETAQENIVEQKKNENEEFEKLYQQISESIDDYKEVVSDKKENVTSDEQFTMGAMIRDKTKTIKQYINKLASLAQNDDQKKKLNEVNEKFDSVEDKHIENVNNNQEVAKDEADAKEAAKEDAPNVISIDHVKKIINQIASNTTNEQQVDEVQRIIKEIQLNEQAEEVEAQKAEEAEAKIVEAEQKDINADQEQSVEIALQKVASNTVNDEQVEEVRKFIKSIEAKAIVDENLKKDEVIKKLIYDISANTTSEEQVKQVQRIIEKIQLYNKFAEDKEQEREDNIAFGHEMAEEIQKTPEEISNDLKVLLVNLVNHAETEEEAAQVASIIDQIKKHDELIKENKAKEEDPSSFVKVPNVETFMVDYDNGSSQQIYLKEEQEDEKPVVKEEVPVINLEEDVEEPSSGNGKGLFVLGAFGVIAIAGVGYTYKSRAKKLNDEFPFPDANLPFSNSMNGLVVDKNFLFRKNSIPKPSNIINNDAVIRPAQPSWATSILMDENNKKGLKDGIEMTEDPEQLLDAQLREIENKEKVIVKTNLPSVVITIDEDNVTTTEPETAKSVQKKANKKQKLRRSVSVISLKKDEEMKEETAAVAAPEKKSRKKKHGKKATRKSKSLNEEKIVEEKESADLDEETELSFNTSFILDAPSILFDDKIDAPTEAETETVNKKNLVLNTEKPKVPKRISSVLPDTKDILPTLPEIETSDDDDCQFSQEFAKELMEKFGEIENDN